MDKLFNPQYLSSLCKQYKLTPSKKYGQNFLINPEVIDKIIAAAELTADDAVVEIGPGFGALTLALAEKAGKVTAFEIEKKLQNYWKEILVPRPSSPVPLNIEIIWGNVLRESIKYLVSSIKYKVVANLPYQITSNVIRKFLESDNPPELMVLMVQKEVGERICAKPACLAEDGSRRRGEMSLLSVAAQFYAQAEIVAFVPRSNFWPEPKVDSAIIKLRIKNDELRINDQKTAKLFFQIVKAGFANRRKLLIKNLSLLENRDVLERIFAKIGLKATARAQELSVEQWIKLIDALKNQK